MALDSFRAEISQLVQLWETIAVRSENSAKLKLTNQVHGAESFLTSHQSLNYSKIPKIL
jgi:hypothetical protein